MKEQLEELIKKGEEEALYSFFRDMPEADKKPLVPVIKKLIKEYSEFSHHSDGGYGYKPGTDKQRNLAQSAAFICFNRSDYEKSVFSTWILEKEKLNKIIDWYCPSWFSDFVNKKATDNSPSSHLNYPWIMELADRGFLQPGKELVVQTLPQAIFHIREGHSWECDPKLLLTHPITLEEHIWWLFELESNLHYSDRWLHVPQTGQKLGGPWIAVFKTLISDGRLSRCRVLQESLLASNRNFNKVLSGWFAQLFAELEPTREELLQLQKELFGVLGAPTSKPVNTALQAIKNILTEKEFEADIFIEAIPVLLSSDTKAVVNSSLILLEKLAQKHAGHREKITRMACQCFISGDEEIQSRAAKLIGKFGDPANAALRQELIVFQEGMRTTVRQLLTHFIGAKSAEQAIDVDTSIAIESTASPGGLTEIPFPTNIDDLAFLASQAFDNNEPWHIDILPAALVQFSPQLKEGDIPLLEPAFQRALKQARGNNNMRTGHLDSLLAFFLIDFGNWLIRKFPGAAEGIKEVYRKFDGKEAETQTSFLVSPQAGSYTVRWTIPRDFAFYDPYKQLLLAALHKIQQGNDRPLLSTPTHTPCWIAPDLLAGRLEDYQRSGEKPDSMDLQVAISRCHRQDTAAALQQVKSRLSGEFQQLLVFLMDENAVPQGPFHYKAAWMVASLSRDKRKEWPAFDAFSYSKTPFAKYTGELKWEIAVGSYIDKQYDHTTGKYVEKVISRKELIPTRNPAGADDSPIKKFFSKLLPGTKEDEPMLFDYMHHSAGHLATEINDIKRILSLTPNNPATILADTIASCLIYPEFYEEGDKKMVTAVAQFLYEAGLTPGEMTWLFLGTCMLNVDKTLINTAGEIWLKEVSAGKIDNQQLGRVIGTQESLEFAPLKRFTDLLTQNLFRVSPLHDRALQTLVEHLLIRLPDEPIKNLKKLLEIYGELLALNDFSIQLDGVRARLLVWEKNAGLKKVVERVLA